MTQTRTDYPHLDLSQPTPPRMVTIREAARLGPLSEYTLRLMLKQGRLPGCYAGTRYLVNLDRLYDQLNAQPQAGLFSGAVVADMQGGGVKSATGQAQAGRRGW